MPGIYIMAALTILVTAVICKTTLDYLTHSDRGYYWLMFAGLPLSLLVNRFIKIPILNTLAAWTDIPLKLGPDMPLWFIALILLNAPVFEEAIKMLPILLPSARSFLNDPCQRLWAGLALGMGFGLGEAAYLAYGITQSPAYNQLPWYMFSGFAAERLIVTFGHGFLTSLAVFGLNQGGRKMLLGYLAAVGLHALMNLTPILLALQLIPTTVASMGSYAVVLAAFIIFQNNLRAAKKINGTVQPEVIYFER